MICTGFCGGVLRQRFVAVFAAALFGDVRGGVRGGVCGGVRDAVCSGVARRRCAAVVRPLLWRRLQRHLWRCLRRHLRRRFSVVVAGVSWRRFAAAFTAERAAACAAACLAAFCGGALRRCFAAVLYATLYEAIRGFRIHDTRYDTELLLLLLRLLQRMTRDCYDMATVYYYYSHHLLLLLLLKRFLLRLLLYPLFLLAPTITNCCYRY